MLGIWLYVGVSNPVKMPVFGEFAQQGHKIYGMQRIVQCFPLLINTIVAHTIV